MSPFNNENKVTTDELVSSNLLYFQKIVCPKNTNPKKNGITPSKNIKRLLQDLDSVDVIKFKLFEYSRYFKIVIQANMTPNPINTYLCLKMINYVKIKLSKMATKAPNNWKKFPVTMTINQKSKNFILSKNPNSYQFLFQSTCVFIRD